MLTTRFELLKLYLRSNKGQGMAEYGLILALVAIAAVGAFTLMQGGLDTLLGNVETELKKDRSQ